MENGDPGAEIIERRHEPRSAPGRYMSVEFCLGALEPVYVFKIHDLSASGMGILIREESGAIKDLKVGQELDMVYRTLSRQEAPRKLRTRIVHLNRKTEGRLKGHYLVGLCVLEGQIHDK
jgi:hypothetical protein